MRPRDGPIIRPLCSVTRAQTRAYCRAVGVQPADDASNRDLHYRRNRVRAELVPHLEAYYNPTVRDALLRLGELAALDSHLMDRLAAEAAQECVVADADGTVTVSCDALDAMHPAIRLRVIRTMIRAVAGSVRDLEHEAVVGIARAAAERRRVGRPLGDGVAVRVTDTVSVGLIKAPASPLPFVYELVNEEVRAIPEAGVGVVLAHETLREIPIALAAETGVIPVGAVSGRLYCRSPRTGDRIRPVGLGGSKKVTDHLRDAGLSRADRARCLVVADDQGVLWLPGVGLDERARIKSLPCDVYRIEVVSCSEPTGLQ
jgi:tRNA(Ile)-lysidine synthase